MGNREQMSQISLKAMLELVDKATAPLKDIMGSSEKTSDALRTQREELRKLSKSQMWDLVKQTTSQIWEVL